MIMLISLDQSFSAERKFRLTTSRNARLWHYVKPRTGML